MAGKRPKTETTHAEVCILFLAIAKLRLAQWGPNRARFPAGSRFSTQTNKQRFQHLNTRKTHQPAAIRYADWAKKRQMRAPPPTQATKPEESPPLLGRKGQMTKCPPPRAPRLRTDVSSYFVSAPGTQPLRGSAICAWTPRLERAHFWVARLDGATSTPTLTAPADQMAPSLWQRVLLRKCFLVGNE